MKHPYVCKNYHVKMQEVNITFRSTKYEFGCKPTVVFCCSMAAPSPAFVDTWCEFQQNYP